MGTSWKSDIKIRSMFLNYLLINGILKSVFSNYILIVVQANLDIRNFIFPFLYRVMFDLRKIYVLNLKTCRPKLMSYVGEFANRDLA